MNSSSFSDPSVSAIVSTYRYFDVRLSEYLGPHFYVVGYRGLLRRFFHIGDELCSFKDVDDAWSLVFIFRKCREGQSLNQQLQSLGIQCPVPESIIRKDGDSHG